MTQPESDATKESVQRDSVQGTASKASSSADGTPRSASGEAPTPRPKPTDASHKQPASARWRIIAWTFRLGLAVVIIIVGGGILGALAMSRPEPPTIEGGVEAPVVEVITLVPVPIAREWSGYGVARAMDAVNLSAEVSAVVTERAVGLEAGIDVDKGDRLFVLERADFERRLEASRQRAAAVQAQLAGLEAEEARLRDQVRLGQTERDIAERDLERVREADRAGAASAGELDAALAALQRSERALAQFRQSLELVPSRRAALEAQRETERTQIALAERELDRTVIVSPFPGRVQTLGPEEGELVVRGELLARVVDLRRVEVPIRLPVSAGLRVRVGDPVELRADAPGSPEWSGEISRAAPEADEQSRTMTVFVEVAQDPELLEDAGLLLPGSFVAASVRSREAAPRLVVPRAAITGGHVLVAVQGEGGARVAVRDVQVDFYVRRPVRELDPVEREWAVLVDEPDADNSVREGDRVIVSNIAELRAGMLIDAEPRVAGGRGPRDAGGGSP